MHVERKDCILYSFPSRSACEIKAPFVLKGIYRGLHTADTTLSHSRMWWCPQQSERKNSKAVCAKVGTGVVPAGLAKGSNLTLLDEVYTKGSRYLGLCRQDFQQAECRGGNPNSCDLASSHLDHSRRTFQQTLLKGRQRAGQGHRGKKGIGRDVEGSCLAQKDEEAVLHVSSVVFKRVWWHREDH